MSVQRGLTRSRTAATTQSLRRALSGSASPLRPLLPYQNARGVMGTASAAPQEVRESITLDDSEAELLNTLLEASKHASSGTVLRCAGGWVRDKLLGRHSNDIDIALDNMLGKDFAEAVNAYLTSQGKETHGVGVIQSNPEQSKHLETATMRVGGQWIDLVNLRSESYADDSRIPTMEFGTPVQDAERRDFTINSLFYNINEGMVEDFTKRGLDDLRAGIIRTPLPAQETFMDDPLRVLRAIKFASRYSFELESTLVEAAASDEVREALGSKVSRERVGTELEGCFGGPSPLLAAQLMHRLRLMPIVFALETDPVGGPLGDFGTPCLAVCKAASELLEARGGRDAVGMQGDDWKLYHIAALLLPLRSARLKKKKKFITVTTQMIKEAIKWKVKDADVVALLHEEVPILLQVHTELKAHGSAEAVPDEVRVRVGLSLRRLKTLIPLAIGLMPLLKLPEAAPLGVDAAHDAEMQTGSESVAGMATMADELKSAIDTWELSDCHTWKPLVDGKAIMEMLGMTRGGREVGLLTAAVVEWQLVNPKATQEECSVWLKASHQDVLQKATDKK